MSLNALRLALVNLYDGDASVQGVTGRNEGNLVLAGTDEVANTPVTTYQVIAAPVIGGTAERRRVLVQLTAWIDLEKGHTPSDLETLIDRAEAVFTTSNLSGEGVDAAVFKGDVRDGLSFAQEGLLSLLEDFTFEVKVA